MGFTGINVDPFFTDAQGNTQDLCWGIQQDGSDVFAMSSKSNGFSPIGFTKLDTSGSIVTTATLDPLNNGSYYYGSVANKPMFAMTTGGSYIVLTVGNRWVAINRSDLSYHTGAAVSTGVSFNFFGYRVALSTDEVYAANLSSAAGLDCGASIFKLTGPTTASWNFKDLTTANQPPSQPVDCQFDNSNNFYVMCTDGNIVQYSVNSSTLAITKTATFKPYSPTVNGNHKMCPRPTAGEFTLWYVDGQVMRWVPGSSSIVTDSQFYSTAPVTAYGGPFGITLAGDRTSGTDKEWFMATVGGGSTAIIITDIISKTEKTLAFSLWSGAGLPAVSGITGGGVYDEANAKIWFSCATFSSGLDVLDYGVFHGIAFTNIWGNQGELR